MLRDADPLPIPLDPHPNPPGQAGARGRSGVQDDDQIFISELRTSNLPKGADPITPEPGAARWSFPLGWVKYALKANAASLRMVGIDGNSMEPDFRSGDHLLIDTDRRAPSPPGVFVMFDGVGLIARALEFLPNSDPAIVLIRSSGEMTSNLEVPLDEIHIVGRAVWHARRL